MKDEDLDKVIRKVANFPKKGILFYDITSILINPEAFNHVINRMVELYSDKAIDAVAGVEARGFFFAAPFAYKMSIPFIPIRKAGKLPGATITKSYSLEYGDAQIEIQKNDISKGKNILLVDDLIATGGTLQAAAALLEMGGAQVNHIFSILGLTFLPYHQVLAKYCVTTLLEYSSEHIN